MGVRNFLVEGVSGAGKTTVADELTRRGVHAVHGDRELAYRGDPATGEPTDLVGHAYHLWDLDRVRAILADRTHPMTFLCGGSRNFRDLLPLLDGVFVLDLDADTLRRRLEARPADEFAGGTGPEAEAARAFVLGLHATGEDIPRDGVRIDATRPVTDVVDEIQRVAAHLRR